MDSKQFDELVARLASTASRRNAVKGVVGGALASVGVTSVAAEKGGQGKAKGPKEGKGPKVGKGPKKPKKGKCKGHGKDPVTICHKGRPITVSRCAFERGHKKHGDFEITYGVACPAV
jgi:hypothetical protein